MKKSYTALLFALSLTATMTAQTKATKKADKFYERLEYADAAKAYQKLADKKKADDYVYTQLANSYYYLNDAEQAEKYYARVADNASAETALRYAEVLKRNGKTAEATRAMQRFAQLEPNDTRAKAFSKNPNYLQSLLNQEPQYTADGLEGVNSKYSDFGGHIHGSDFYFASAQNKRAKTYKWNDQPYLEIYKANIENGEITNAQLLKGDVNTKYHESSVSITPDGKRMYFDRNDFHKGKYKKGADGVNQIHIYYAENVNGTWRDVQKAPFNHVDYSTGHPAVSPDGKYLYFSSDREGVSNLYRVEIKGNQFGEPEKLPAHINTNGKEVFPFVDKEGTLYFSSDGHPGMGGLDVFYAKAQGNSFGEVVNLGPGVNSSADDFAYSYNPETKEGFVSSDRSGGLGSDDIYRVKLIEICETMFAVTVKDSKTNELLGNAKVILYDSNNNIVATKTTNALGIAEFDADCEAEYIVEGSLDNYEDNALTFEATTEEKVSKDLLLDRIIVEDKIVINPIHFDFDKSIVKPEAALELDRVVAVMKKHETMEIKVEAHTDSRGNNAYNQKLSERRAEATVAYIISQGIDASRVSSEGYGSSQPVVDCKANCTEEDHATNRRSDFVIIKR